MWLLWSVDRERLLSQLLRTDWRWFLLAMRSPGRAPRAGVSLAVSVPATQRAPRAVPAMMIGYMVNNMLPLRRRDRAGVRRGSPRERAFWTAAATLIVERVLDSLCLVLILGVLVFLVEVPRIVEWAAMIILTIDVVGISLLVAITTAPTRCRALIERMTARWPALQDRLLRAFTMFLDGLDGIRTRGHALPLVVWTVVVWMLPAAAAWASLRATHLCCSAAGLGGAEFVGWIRASRRRATSESSMPPPCSPRASSVCRRPTGRFGSSPRERVIR